MSDLDDLAALSALARDEPPGSPTVDPPSDARDCANCGATLAGRYCADCGQLDQPLRIPLHRFVAQSFTEFFGIDGRVWRTLGALLFKPGTLTRAYLGGQRMRYLRPLRVYLISTLLFFFLLSLLDPVGRSQDAFFDSDASTDTVTVAAHAADNDSILAVGYGTLDDERADVADEIGLRDSLARQLRGVTDPEARADLEDDLADVREDLADALDELREDSLDRAETLQRARIEAAILAAMPQDSLISLDDIHGATRILYPDSAGFVNGNADWFVRSEAIRGIAGAPTEAQRRANAIRFVRSVIGYVPTVLFVILPIFALLLKLLYIRRGWYYSEHLVFGLHTHAFAFAVFNLIAILAWIASGVADKSVVDVSTGILALVLMASIPVYFYIAQKRVYGQGWIKTALKALVLSTLYNTVLIFGLVAVFLLAAYFG